jgi:hypothetical protein
MPHGKNLPQAIDQAMAERGGSLLGRWMLENYDEFAARWVERRADPSVLANVFAEGD